MLLPTYCCRPLASFCEQHSGATASLNVNAACAVVLHHFAQWALLPEAPKQGYKYDVDTRHLQSVPHSGVALPLPLCHVARAYP